MSVSALPPLPLPRGLRERQIQSHAPELSFHVIEAGPAEAPLILLLHGFPELAYSWRKVMPGLANTGYYVVAVDQRGYGRTTGWDNRGYEEVDLNTFSIFNLIRDMVVLVHELGYQEVYCVVGHDLGAIVASFCALSRPDLFKRVVLMSHPFKVPTLNRREAIDLSALGLKYYRDYYCTAKADQDMVDGDLLAFLRAYFYMKSADWKNNPHPLERTAESLAHMPEYYIMPEHAGMRDVMVDGKLTFMSDDELSVYTQEYKRTGFQGGLNWYRVQKYSNYSDVFAGKKIEVPCVFIAGKQDWGIYQEPGALEKMGEACTMLKGVNLVDGAGHWVQQEKPEEVVLTILAFLRS